MYTLIPEAFHRILSRLLQYLWRRRSTLSLSLSGIIMLWSASKGTTAITDGLYMLMDKALPCSFWKRRFRGAVCFLVMLCALVPITAFVFLQDRLAQRLPQVQLLFSFILLSSIFSLLFYFLPKKRIPFHFCYLGGCFSSFGWIGTSWLFTLYIRCFSGTSRLYGGLGIFVIGGVWMHICVLVLLYGGLLAALCESGTYHPLKIIIQTFRHCS